MCNRRGNTNLDVEVCGTVGLRHNNSFAFFDRNRIQFQAMIHQAIAVRTGDFFL